MLAETLNQYPRIGAKLDLILAGQIELAVFDDEFYKLLADLSPDIPWGDREIAAKKLGNRGNPEATPALLEALPDDPFWMVRYAMIQALEKIGDRSAVPTLQWVAECDSFQVVRSYAARAIERLT